MLEISRGRARLVPAAFALGCCVVAPAWCDDAAPAAHPDARASIERAIQHQESRRSAGIAAMIAGGVFIVGGSIDSAVASAQNHDDKNQGRPSSHNPYVGYAVGLGVGLPIMGLGGWLFADSQHQINALRRQKLSVSYAPDTHQPVLQLSFSY